MKITKRLIKKLLNNIDDVLKELTKKDIISIIQKANYYYYNTDKPLFSDNIYDIIFNYLKLIDPCNTILTNIGNTINDKRKVLLPYFMGSINKIKDEKKILNWVNNYKEDYIISDKLDGVSGMIHINNKNDIKIYTRGNGTYGQDISHLKSYIKGIPNIINMNEIVIRGELIIKKSSTKINIRNIVSGIVNAKVPDLNITNKIEFIAYELIHPILDPKNQMLEIEKMGFNVVYNIRVNYIDIIYLSKLLEKRRNKCFYEIDGLVVTHNKIHERIKGNPKYNFAFKHINTLKKLETIVTKVDWNISKDKYLIPVINFIPVEISGIIIKKTTGFNAKFIYNNKIGPGSKIIIIRSGDVIPYISNVLCESDTKNPQMPIIDYIWDNSKINIISQDDNNIDFKNIDHFFKQIKIYGLSTGILKKMYDNGFRTIKSILQITKKDLLEIPGFKNKLSEKIYHEINIRINNLDYITVMYASNTLGRGMGIKTIKLIVDNFPNIVYNNYIPIMEELIEIKFIEKNLASLFILNLPYFFNFIEQNEISNLKYVKIIQNVDIKSSIFENKKIAITGFRNKEVEKFIILNGGIITNNINKYVILLIAKNQNKDTKKIINANDLKIEIISLNNFLIKYNLKIKN
jgi:DNA ligase (NAD+)